MTEPTARPWITKGGVLIFRLIQFGRDEFIAEASHDNQFIDRDAAEANAALIVKAVNRDDVFDKLVQALEAFLDCKTALRIACPTCTVTLGEKHERTHEEGCPVSMAAAALEEAKP